MSVVAREIISYTIHGHFMFCGYVAILQMQTIMSVAVRVIISYTIHRHFMFCGYVAILQIQPMSAAVREVMLHITWPFNKFWIRCYYADAILHISGGL
jgi:hypothetical protein